MILFFVLSYHPPLFFCSCLHTPYFDVHISLFCACLFTARCSLFVVRCSLFVVRCSLFVVHSSFVIVHRLSLIVRRPSITICRSSFGVLHLVTYHVQCPVVVCCLLFVVRSSCSCFLFYFLPLIS